MKKVSGTRWRWWKKERWLKFEWQCQPFLLKRVQPSRVDHMTIQGRLNTRYYFKFKFDRRVTLACSFRSASHFEMAQHSGNTSFIALFLGGLNSPTARVEIHAGDEYIKVTTTMCSMRIRTQEYRKSLGKYIYIQMRLV